MLTPRASSDPARILLLTANDPTAESGLGIRLRSTIQGLAEVGTLDVLSFGGEKIDDASERVAELFATRVDRYRTSRRVARRPTIAGYCRWILGSRLPRQLYFADYTVERQVFDEVELDRYDLVWCATSRAFLILPERLRAPVVVDLSQFEADRDLELLARSAAPHSMRDKLVRTSRSVIARTDRRRWIRTYRRICAEAAATTICSPLDRDLVGDRSITVVPNAYPDPELRARRDVDPEAPQIMLAGYFAYQPNVDAATTLAEHVLPLVREQVPGARLVLVGGATKPVEHLADLAGVSVLGFVPDIGAELVRTDLVAAPIDVVAGTNLKVLEALAYGIPVVVSTRVARSLELRDGVDALIRDQAPEIAAACVTLLTDPERRHAQIDAGRLAYETNFRDEQVHERFASLAASVLGSSEVGEHDGS